MFLFKMSESSSIGVYIAQVFMLLRRRSFLLILMTILGINLCAKTLQKVTLQLKWQHQFQFAGYYAAQLKGYYKDAGLDVNIVPATPYQKPIDQIIAGRAEFGIGASDLILLRDKGVPVVILASVFQHSPLVLLTLKKDCIQSIHDIVNGTVMIEDGSAEIIAYLKNEGINLSDFKMVSHSYGVNDLVEGKVDAMTAYVTSEAFLLKELGVDYIAYSPRAVGIDFYSDNLFTTEKVIEENPELVEKFRLASLKGWSYAMHNQEEIIQLIHNQYHSNFSLDALRFEAKQMERLLQIDLIEIGHMNPNRWKQIMNVYKDLGMLRGDVDLSKCLYNQNSTRNNKRFYVIIALTVFLLLLAIFIALRFIRLSQRLKTTIKELRNTQKALNMSDSKYQLLIENNPNIIYSLDTNGCFTFASTILTTKLGYEISEVLGKNFQFLIHPEDAPNCLALFHKALFYGEPQTAIEYRVKKKTGEWLWNTVSLAPLKDENGEITLLIGTASDITEKKLVQLALLESEAKHRMLTDLSGDMIVMHRNFEKYYVNPAVEQTLGYTQVEFLKTGFLDLVHPNDKEFVEKNINADSTELREKNYNSDFRLKHKEGYYVDFSAHIIVHQINAHNFITVINLRNITDKVKSDREIRKLSTAVNQTPATIVITNLDGDIEYVNPHFTSVTGYSFDEAVGKNPRILQSNYHSKEFYQDMWEKLTHGLSWNGEIYNKRKDGTYYWEDAIMAPVLGDNGEIINFVAIKTDITQRKIIEIKIKEQNEQLQTLIDTKDRFISILAHDLRNPFHALLGLSEILSLTIEPDEIEAIRLANAIKATASNTFELLENILKWASSQQNTFTPTLQSINLLEVATECTTLIHEQALLKEISFKVSIEKGVTIFADVEMLKTILRNLLGNAVKFSHKGGVVSIDAITTESHISIKVTDAGIGMHHETIESLFKLGNSKSTQGTAGEKGTGFGLILCKELIEKINGTISVTSQINKGTTFTITLPKQ